MNPQVDAFLERQNRWREELTKLRVLLLKSGLTEELRWGKPCYALDGKNVALLHGFKEYCAILFHKGSLLADPSGVLIQQTKHVQAARQIRFTSVQDVTRLEKTVKAYVSAAIEVERQGLRVPFKKTEDFEVPEELATELAASAKLKKAFAALTPGRQRGYIFHFSQPKQSKTRVARVEKHRPRILEGLGLDDESPRPQARPAATSARAVPAKKAPLAGRGPREPAIDAYLAAVSPESRALLAELRKTIHALVPEVEECISYRLPAFRYCGRIIAGFSATSKGCSYYPFSGSTLKTLSADLEAYDRTKSAVHFSPKQLLPASLVKKLLRARIAEGPR